MCFLKLKLNNIVELSLGCMLSPKATSINDVTTNYQYLDTLSLLATPVMSAKWSNAIILDTPSYPLGQRDFWMTPKVHGQNGKSLAQR